MPARINLSQIPRSLRSKLGLSLRKCSNPRVEPQEISMPVGPCQFPYLMKACPCGQWRGAGLEARCPFCDDTIYPEPTDEVAD